MKNAKKIFKSLGLDKKVLQGGDLPVYSPIDGAEIARVKKHTAEEAQQMAAHAVDAFKVWRSVPAPRRGELVRIFGNILRDNKDALGALVTLAFWGMISLILRRLGGEPRYAAGVVSRIAQGDLTAPVTLHPNDTSSLLYDIRQMRDKLRDAMQEIHSTSTAVDHNAGDIAAGNQELSSRTEQQAAALQQTSSSMEEVTATVRQTADSVEQAKELVRSAGYTPDATSGSACTP